MSMIVFMLLSCWVVNAPLWGSQVQSTKNNLSSLIGLPLCSKKVLSLDVDSEFAKEQKTDQEKKVEASFNVCIKGIKGQHDRVIVLSWSILKTLEVIAKHPPKPGEELTFDVAIIDYKYLGKIYQTDACTRLKRKRAIDYLRLLSWPRLQALYDFVLAHEGPDSLLMLMKEIMPYSCAQWLVQQKEETVKKFLTSPHEHLSEQIIDALVTSELVANLNLGPHVTFLEEHLWGCWFSAVNNEGYSHALVLTKDGFEMRSEDSLDRKGQKIDLPEKVVQNVIERGVGSHAINYGDPDDVARKAAPTYICSLVVQFNPQATRCAIGWNE